MRKKIVDRIHCFLQDRVLKKICFFSTLPGYMHNSISTPMYKNAGLYYFLSTFETNRTFLKPTSNCASLAALRYLSATSSITEERRPDSVGAFDDSNGEVEPIDSWEEEDDAEPEVGDGGDGGGVVLQNCPWGDRALSIAQEILAQFGEDMELYAFKTSPRGYIYVRLDKLSNEYGCPCMEDIESFSRLYKEKLDEVGATKEIPDDLALEVSSPGAERLLRVPEDLLRFRDVPMVVSYLEDSGTRCLERSGVYSFDSIETESKCCIWRLADVKENRDPSAKGRPLSRKQKDQKLKLPYHTIKQVTLYVCY